jgi:hypothetical protein
MRMLIKMTQILGSSTVDWADTASWMTSQAKICSFGKIEQIHLFTNPSKGCLK